jgi:hypothetical protein
MNDKPHGKDPMPLARDRDRGRLDRVLREDLERIRVSEVLARADASATLTRAIEQAVRAPLAVAEISAVLDRIEGPLMAEFQTLLESPSSGLQIERHVIDELLRAGAEGPMILKRGLAFLKHKRYKEAVEWWALNRRNLDSTESPLNLLLLIMESLTHFWAGDRDQADAIREKIRAHKLYQTTSTKQTKA